jgi:Fanconi anemia group M protein
MLVIQKEVAYMDEKKRQKTLSEFMEASDGPVNIQSNSHTDIAEEKNSEKNILTIFKIVDGFVSYPVIKPGIMIAKQYQLSIAEEGTKKNVLVVLPTGTGKTEIAVLIYAKLFYEGRDKMLLIASSKPLAAQARDRFNYWLNPQIESALLTGTTKQKERASLWLSSKMIFATPQTVEEDLKRGRYNLKDLSLLVIDEAHRTIGNHAYVNVVNDYIVQQPAGKIVALTASTGSDVEKVMELKRNLHIDKILYRSKDSIDLSEHMQEVVKEVIKVKLPDLFIDIRNLLRSYAMECFDKLKKNHLMEQHSFNFISKKMIQSYFTSDVDKQLIDNKRYDLLVLKYILMVLLDMVNYIETESIFMLRDYIKNIIREDKEKKRYETILSRDDRIVTAFEMASKYNGIGHPKETKLLEILKLFFETHAKSVVIVFTNYRRMAEEITQFLNDNGLQSDKLVGQGSKSDGKGMSQKEQTEVLDRFKNRDFRVLITTNIGEEGLDIPNADMIVFYDAVSSEIRKIQRMGRTGRHRIGKVVFLLAEDTQDIGKFYSSTKKEQFMYSILKGVDNQEMFD